MSFDSVSVQDPVEYFEAPPEITENWCIKIDNKEEVKSGNFRERKGSCCFLTGKFLYLVGVAAHSHATDELGFTFPKL